MLASAYVVLLLWAGIVAVNYYLCEGVGAWSLRCRDSEQAGSWGLYVGRESGDRGSQTFPEKKGIVK